MEYTDNKPLVSVWMITYNHEPYIAEAIEGVLMQKTDFPIELVIGEDCSTDRTREICIAYQRKHPDIIRLLMNEKNIGMMPNFIKTMEACQGKYIALCEGDDYWTDPLKLQKQVDFLEGSPDFVGAFHDSIILDEATGTEQLRIGNAVIDEEPDLDSIILKNNIPTASLLFRNVFTSDFWSKQFEAIAKGDYLLVVLLARYGKFKYFNPPMSVYRVHAGGVWSTKSRLYTVEQDIKFYRFLDNLFHAKTTQKAISFKLRNACHKYAIELVKAGKIGKSLRYLWEVIAISHTKQPSRIKCVYTYLVVLASKVKSVCFPFLPPLSSFKK